MSSAVTPQRMYLASIRSGRRVVRSVTDNGKSPLQPEVRQATNTTAETSLGQGVSSFVLLLICGAVSVAATAALAGTIISQLLRFSIHDLMRAISGIG